MSTLFLVVAGCLIGSTYGVAWMVYKKTRNIYLVSWFLLGAGVTVFVVGTGLAVLLIRDAYSVVYGLQLGGHVIGNAIAVRIGASFFRRYKMKKQGSS